MNEITIAKSFFKSANSLSKLEKATAMEFIPKFFENPASPGFNFETVKSAKDSNFKSARINDSIRAIVYKSGKLFTLLYAASHDEAYKWAKNRKIEKHPISGVIQIIETAEEVREKFEAQQGFIPIKPMFDGYEDNYLISLGLPEEWLPTIRLIKTEDQLYEALEKLPEEVIERFLLLAAGEFVTPPEPPQEESIESNPDNLRTFWVVKDAEELVELLEKPIEEWMKFLHPSQSNLARGKFKGPVKVTGSAGTGKTVVAMHRAKHLAEQGKRVLITSFVTTLCQNIERNLLLLCTENQRSRICVSTVHSQALQIARKENPSIYPIDDKGLKEALEKHLEKQPLPWDHEFLFSEWRNVIQRQGLETWRDYKNAQRKGRVKQLGVNDRMQVWEALDSVLQELKAEGGMPWASISRFAKELIESGKTQSPHDAVIVDEIQDLSADDLGFLAALCPEPGNLMLVGDAGQRIYGSSISLNKVGIEVRGRSHVLKINYRTSEQIRKFADKILDSNIDDLDGGLEDRTKTKSLFGGPEPILKGFDSVEDEYTFVLEKISALTKQGINHKAIAIFARAGKLLDPFRKALDDSNVPYLDLSKSEKAEINDGVNLGTMHRAKGLEFKVVFAVGCSRANLPLKSASLKIEDPVEQQDFLEREKNLLYVAITRARDEAYILWSGNPSKFINNINSKAD